MARGKRTGCGVWLLFWIIIFLAILILILLNKRNFKKSDISKYIKPYINKATRSKVISPVKKTPQKIKVYLYFVKYIESLDKLKLVCVERTIPATTTPLIDTLRLLIKGPTSQEESKGITSVFPGNVKLLGVNVKNGIAYIDFNSEIETGIGIPMLQARLYQIIYTATQFPAVKKVRILINGKAKDTFSAEGLSIKHPLGRLNSEPIF